MAERLQHINKKYIEEDQRKEYGLITLCLTR